LALSHNWEDSVSLNEQIVELEPENIPALNRLARAHLETGKPKVARKYLRKVIKLDPLNKTAQKNLELSKKSRGGHKHNDHGEEKEVTERKAAAFIHEPGTTKLVEVKVSAKGFNSKSFHTGDNFEIKLKGERVSLYHEDKFVGYLTLPKQQKELVKLLKNKEKVVAAYKDGSRGVISAILKTKTPIFQAEKQEVKPYTYYKDERPEVVTAITNDG